MTDLILSKKYIDITLNNTSTTTQRIDFQKESNVNIVDNASQYDLSIIRFKIPSSSITKYKIPANSARDVIYMRQANVRDGANRSTKSVFASANLAGSSDILITDTKQLIDYINRAIYRCYFNYLNTYTPSLVVQGNIGNQTWNLATETFNFNVAVPNGANKIGYISVDFNIDNVVPEFDSIAFDLKVSLLVNGTEVVMLSNPDYTQSNQLRYINFQDGNFTSSFVSYNNASPILARHPEEPFYKVYDVQSWTANPFQIRFSCSNTPANMNFSVTAGITVAFIDQATNRFPIYTPFYSIDSSNMINFNYSASWYKNGPQLGLSDRLRNILDSFDYYLSGQQYLIIPQQPLSDDETVNKSIKQLQSSLFRINEIDKIEFTSIIPVEFENLSGSTTSGILTDFAIDPSQIGQDYYIYNATNDYRRYRLLSNVPLRKISFTAYAVYLDGSREVIVSRPGESASLKIQLSPVNSLIG